MTQIVLTLLLYAILVGIMVFCGLIWRSNVKRTELFQQSLIDITTKSLETAHMEAESNRKLVALLEGHTPP